MMVWFTVQLEDKPGSLARVAAALGERGVNITGIVGVAEDTDGALMLTTSDAAATREAFIALEFFDGCTGADGVDLETDLTGQRPHGLGVVAGDELERHPLRPEVREGVGSTGINAAPSGAGEPHRPH